MNELEPSSGSFIGRLFSPKGLRWLLLLAAVVITVVGLFYTEENWRGKRAWKQFKKESMAKGIDMEWLPNIPPPVADDENFFAAPDMQKWFVGRNLNDFSKLIDYNNLDESMLERSVVPAVDVTVVPANASVAPGDADLVLQYDRPLLSTANPAAGAEEKQGPNANQTHVQISAAALKQMTEAIKAKTDAFNPGGLSPKLSEIGPRLIGLKPLPATTPLRIVVQTDNNPTTNEMKEFLPKDSIVKLGIFFPGQNSMRAQLTSPVPYVPVADYLAWSDSLRPQFDEVRAALDRPYARMDGAYEDPSNIPIPNFVCMRGMTFVLAHRAQCYLLLGEPEKALAELTTIHKLCRVLEGRPTGKPMTLIAAMINVALRGVYVDILADGLELHAWQEPQLAVIQQQLAETDLLPIVQRAFHFEFICFGFVTETYSNRDLMKLFDSNKKKGFWEAVRDPDWFFLMLAPHGWTYQNAVTDATLGQESLDSFDLSNRVVLPQKAEKSMRELQAHTLHPGPYSYLAIKAVPNFFIAKQTAAYNQTLVNEGQIVCALERYRLEHGNYPEAPHALAPKFIETFPHDLFGGEALKYRREGGSFVLYSIGWNEKDDGGITEAKRDQMNRDNYGKKDWVWPFGEESGK